MKRACFTFFAFVFLGLFPAAAAERDAGKTSPAFSANDLSAEHDAASILTIATAGRYAIRAHSASGARIELIDMIAGPGESAGQAGLRDGRIDALLDKGAYKIRIFNAKGASGKVKLTAEPFVEADAKRPALTPGRIESAELGDLQQRSYHLDVDASGRVWVEAVGRALNDLRLWRDDGELIELPLERTSVEPKPGHAMTRLRLEGAVAPGRYVVTAYGGEKLVWSDGAPAQPLLLRLDSPALLAAGVAEGVIGPFGAARYEAPASYNAFRLELPQIAPARLDAERGKLRQSASIDKTSREPVAEVRLAEDEKQPAHVEITGREGQAFSLRAVRQASRHAFEAEGLHRIWLDLAGEGADEVQATALFARIDKDGKTQVVAADAPKVGEGRAYRAKFNLRGPTSILFEAATSGPVVIDAKGVKARAEIQPALGALAPRADGRAPARYDLQAGFYFLSLEPQGDAAGVVDVTLGPPGLTPAPPPAATPRAIISFGDQKLEKDGSYLILANAAPSLLTGPRVVSLPADLGKAPLPLFQPADAEISVAIRAPKAGAIAARDEKGAAVPVTLADEKIENDTRSATVKIAPSGAARAIGLVFAPEPPAKVAEEKAQAKAGATLSASVGKASFFDLSRDETKQLRFEVPQGGLYRIETLGRLRTALEIGTSFTPALGSGEDNGPGHNGLVTAYLRAGPYRAAVTAKESSGHLGLAVTPATLVTTRAIAGAGEARATLDSGKGAIIPFEIPQEGLYRIELLGLARDWRARLEDAEGWPLTKPGEATQLTRRFETGAYRLVVLPEDVEGRMVARLAPVVTPPPLAGHGPHDLPFDAPQKLQWREPQERDAPRAPDVWRFSLAGDADVELAIGEGMVAELIKGEKDGVGKAAGARKFARRLGAGDYRVEARALSRDDRLDYEISLTSKELQPGAPRRIEPPATLAFSLASDRLVDLTSFGDREMLGALKDANGALVEQLQGRADDWNIALSRRLPAGSYTLELSAIGAKREPAGTSEEGSDEAGQETSQETNEETSEDQAQEKPPQGVEIRLALPAEQTAGTLALSGSQKFSTVEAQVFALPIAPEGGLTLVFAQSAREIALALEQRAADGAWRPIGLERGLAPMLAWPASREERRIVVWPVGGGDATITLSARLVERRGQTPGDIALERVEDLGLCVGLAALPSAALVIATIPAAGLAAGSAPGAPLRAIRSGPLAPQGDRLWLAARGDCKEKAHIAAFDWGGEEISLDLSEGQRAELPPLPAPKNKARLWIARPASGHVGLDAGRGMTVAGEETLALDGGAPLHVWNASGAAPLRLALRAVDVALLPAAQGGAAYRGTLAPLTAQPLIMRRGEAALELDLPAGTAAFSPVGSPRKFADYAGAAALSLVENRATDAVWLVNLSQTPAPVRVAVAPGKSEPLAPGRVISGFRGAAGRMALTVAAQRGDKLTAIGGAVTFVSDSGAVVTSRTMTLDGGGAVLLDHPPGLVALWLERGGKGPWPPATPRRITTPQRLALEGGTMAFALTQEKPAMLHVRANAPAIVAFSQNGKRETEAFASGVEFHRYLDAGEATLNLHPPTGGPLSGLLDIDAEPVIEAHEGINDPVTLAPGARALFTFETTRDGEIGVGLRAEPDRAQARLLDASGRPIGEGVAQLRKLTPGRYFVEIAAPADAPLSVVRLAVLGLSPPPAGPPDEVVAEFLQKAGLKKNKR